MTTEQDINDFTTKGGINIRRTTEPETYEGARMLWSTCSTRTRGVLLSSDFEYPVVTRDGTWDLSTRRWKFRQSAARRVCGR